MPSIFKKSRIPIGLLFVCVCVCMCKSLFVTRSKNCGVILCSNLSFSHSLISTFTPFFPPPQNFEIDHYLILSFGGQGYISLKNMSKSKYCYYVSISKLPIKSIKNNCYIYICQLTPLLFTTIHMSLLYQ